MNKNFDWGTLGKADYAQSSALIASLPEDIRCELDGVDKELATRILHLSWWFTERSGRSTGWCYPTLNTLARYCYRSVRTVERHIRKLAELGIIEWKQRSTREGKQTSNLYQMGKRFLATLFARQGKKVQRIQTLTKMSTNDLKREYKASAPSQRGERLTDFLQKIRETQPLRSLGATAALAPSHGWDEE